MTEEDLKGMSYKIINNKDSVININSNLETVYIYNNTGC
jgi:hypothetical protein